MFQFFFFIYIDTSRYANEDPPNLYTEDKTQLDSLFLDPSCQMSAPKQPAQPAPGPAADGSPPDCTA